MRLGRFVEDLRRFRGYWEGLWEAVEGLGETGGDIGETGGGIGETDFVHCGTRWT